MKLNKCLTTSSYGIYFIWKFLYMAKLSKEIIPRLVPILHVVVCELKYAVLAIIYSLIKVLYKFLNA